jgi:hypothetical protein
VATRLEAIAVSVRICVAVAIFLQVLAGAASAQDRPLIEPLRLGYIQADSVGDRILNAVSLERALWRKGFTPDWHAYPDGLAAIRALDAGELDIALGLSISDVAAAKQADLAMVFVNELRTILPSTCEMEQAYADHTLKRYTLTNEYLANYREDILLTVHLETIRALQRQDRSSRATNDKSRPDPVSPPPAVRAALVTRDLMLELGRSCAQRTVGPVVELTDINYWMPRSD